MEGHLTQCTVESLGDDLILTCLAETPQPDRTKPFCATAG